MPAKKLVMPRMPARLVKGSKAARDYMAKLRAMRSSKPKSAPKKSAKKNTRKKTTKSKTGGSFASMGRRIGGASDMTLLQRLKQLRKIVEGKQY
jgi:hypothetical protein